MTDAEILAAIDVRLGKIPGTRSPELHRLLSLMLTVQHHQEARLQALEAALRPGAEPVVAQVPQIVARPGMSAGMTAKKRQQATAQTRRRAGLTQDFP